MPGTEITLVADDEVDHLYAILGPPNFPESAYVDPWPENPSVADMVMYGLKHSPESWTYFQGVADGRDLRAEGLKWLHPLPDRPPRKQPLNLEQAVAYIAGPDAKSVYCITSTKEGYNSDSDAQDLPRRGLTLNNNAFAANAADGFRAKHQSIAQVAYMRAASHAAPSVTSKSSKHAAGASKYFTESSGVAKSRKP
ncbi:hypothetical protein ACIQB5_48100 [Streptomyces sp. NPDC088560]|uniref:hypothetical protein n=1 Tax=Streptomyces sp. NPDC088560 TaxID=3365868 RepID=UPI0038195DB5